MAAKETKAKKVRCGEQVQCGENSRFVSFCYYVLQKSAAKGTKKLTGYMLFAKEHRPKVKEEHPDMTFGETGKKLGEMWRALSDKEKQEFKDRKG